MPTVCSVPTLFTVTTVNVARPRASPDTVSDTVSDARRQKITEIESELRLCVHRAGQSAGRPVAEADLELERDEEIEGGIAGVRERLALPSDAAAAATSDAQSATFAWRGTKTPIQVTLNATQHSICDGCVCFFVFLFSDRHPFSLRIVCLSQG